MGRRWQDVAGWARSVRLGGDRLGRLRLSRRWQAGQAVTGCRGKATGVDSRLRKFKDLVV